MRICLMFPVVLVLATVPSAWSSEFWIAYEGNVYPEEDGWTRFTLGGGAQRSLVNGALVLDGMASWDIVDNYYIETPLVLAPGEVFIAEWRVLIADVEDYLFDPGIAIWPPGHGAVEFDYAEDALWSPYENAWVYFTPGVYHDYVFSSADMVAYTLQIDGELARTGQFVGWSPESFVGWGDTYEGARSLTEWDHFRFGIVPEPGAAVLGLVQVAVVLLIRSPRRRSRP